MTIQLLHTFNGYAPGIYSSMGSTEEARLVGLGLARYYTVGMDGKNTVFSESEKAAGQALVSGAVILNGATAGQDSGWLPLIGGGFRLAYALDSGTTSTTFSIDISTDGVASLGQAFTGTWASSTTYEDTGQRLVSNIAAKFFRFNVLTGGPLSVNRMA